MKATLLALAVGVVPFLQPLRAEEPEKITYTRVEQDAQAARLQIALTRYEKDGVKVDLVGAVHIGDKAYYDELNTRFDAYDRVLFEMVGGEKLAVEPEKKADAKPAAGKAEASMLTRVYGMTAKLLGLVGQMEHINYKRENFVHADLTEKQFKEKQQERGESLLGFAMKNAENSRKAGGQAAEGQKVLEALFKGKNSLKLELIKSLGAADDQLASMTGESVIVTDRNIRCLEVLDEELAKGHKNVAIFYGAAHFPDMASRMEERGFTRVSQEWITAWDVPVDAEAGNKEPEPAEPAEIELEAA